MAITKERSSLSSRRIYKVGILTCSTSRTQKEEDITARALKKCLEKFSKSFLKFKVSHRNPHHKDFESSCRFEVDRHVIVPDQVKQISGKLKEWSDSGGLNLILTTGGTGFSPADVTPEATRLVLDREAPNLEEAMRRNSTSGDPLIPYLSRGVCGLRKKTLILNLPGSPKGAVESLQAIFPLLPHILNLNLKLVGL